MAPAMCLWRAGIAGEQMRARAKQVRTCRQPATQGTFSKLAFG